MDKETVIDRVKTYTDVVCQHFLVQKIILFGSQVSGTATDDSDIDVAVIFKRIDEDYWETAAKLFHLRRNIDSRIEPVLFEEGHDPSGFLEEILRTGEVIYSVNE